MMWQIGETWCRARPDALDPNGLIVDLKTSQDASPDAFARTAATFKYHLQAAWYIDGLHAAGVTPEQTAFAFVVIEKTPPHSVGTYVLDAESLVDLLPQEGCGHRRPRQYFAHGYGSSR